MNLTRESVELYDALRELTQQAAKLASAAQKMAPGLVTDDFNDALVAAYDALANVEPTE